MTSVLYVSKMILSILLISERDGEKVVYFQSTGTSTLVRTLVIMETLVRVSLVSLRSLS